MRTDGFRSTDLRQTLSPAHAEPRERLNAVNNAQRWELCRETTALGPRAY